LSGSSVANVLDGLGGVDTLSLANATAAVTVNLTDGTSKSGTVTDIVKNFENILGSAFDDVMTGNLGRNLFTGGGGNDTVTFTNVLQDEGGVAADLTIVGAQNTLASGYDTFVSIRNLTGSVNDDSLTGDTQANVLTGGDGNDTLRGGGANDTVTGGAGADQIDGGNGADLISGGTGLDRLTGGLGADVFLFDTAANPANIDRIADFVSADDTIQLDHLVFTGLTAGALAVAAFTTNTTGLAGDDTDRIIYQTTTGNLYYDADGNGSVAAMQIATLTGAPAVALADFFVL
jgi:Ca2+-binding RTX toxin-like protein